MGAGAYKVLDDIQHLPEGGIIEIGADRGEGSTKFFRQYAKTNGRDFVSLDVDPLCGDDKTLHVLAECYLKGRREPVAFAYMDGFDFIYDIIKNKKLHIRQQERYAELGIAFSNEESKKSHLEQVKSICKISENTWFLFDDTFRGGGWVWDGKGGTAVPYLLNSGGKIRKQTPQSELQWKSYVLIEWRRA